MTKSQLQRLSLEKAQAYRTPDQERREQASTALAEAKIAAAIEHNLASAPPLTPAQVKRLSGLLRSSK